MYDQLFKRIMIGNVEIKNRIFKPAAENAGCVDGYVSKHLVEFHAEQARGGTGLIITGLNVVTPMESVGHEGHAFIEREDRVFGFGELTQAIRNNGAVACCQLGHFGSHGNPPARCVSLEGLERVGDEEWLAVLYPHLVAPGVKKPHKEYTIDEIHDLVSCYGNAAKLAKQAQYDMVEIHAGHRHGLGCFLSPLTNRRKDEYGGSVENRARILYEIVADIQKKCGKSFPIIVRLNGVDGPGVFHSEEIARDGQQIEHTIEICKKLEEMGVAAVDISVQDTNVPMQNISYGVAVEYAGIIKQHVSIPVLVAGSVKVPDLAEEVLESGKADMIGTARALYADPYWPKKLKAGRADEIRPCVRCMECVNDGRYNWNGPMTCTMNTALAKPELAITRAEEKKKVAIIGGGVAGMEAARVATLRGHEVTLFEKRELGGVLNEASVPPFKADLRRMLQYFTTQMEKLNVKIVYKEATPEDVKDFDHVIVATGASRVEIKVPGTDGPNVVHALDVLHDKPELGQKITVIGGGAVGAETALWLAQQGRQVTIVEMMDTMMEKDMYMIKVAYEGMIRQLGVKVLLGHKVQSMDEHKVTVMAKDGTVKEIETDHVVIAAGLKRNLALRDELDQMDFDEVGTAGDCLKPAQLFDAIHAGFVSAFHIE